MPKIIDFKPGARSGGYKIDSANVGVRKTFRDVYVIQGDSAADTEDTILLTTPDLPSLYDFSRGAFLQGMKAEEVDTHALLWEASMDYDSRLDPDNAEQASGGMGMATPDSLQPKWEWDAETVEEVIEFDQVSGDRMENIVGEKIITTSPREIPVLNITRFQTSFSENTILNYSNRTNSSTFWGWPAGTALMGKIRDSVFNGQSGVNYRQVTYQVKFNDKRDKDGTRIGWKYYALHEGTMYFKDTYSPGSPESFVSRNKVPFKDQHGHRTKGNLQTNGRPVEFDSEINYLAFNKFAQADLNALSLGPW